MMGECRGFKTISSVFVVGSVAAIAIVACSGKDRGFANTDTPPLVDPSDASAEASSVGCLGLHCSRDLKRVLQDCDGEERTVATCSSDQGCGDGKCIDACEAAKLSKGSMGCEFWTVPPDDIEYNVGDCYAAMIANTWDRPVTIGAALGADSLDISKSTYIAHKDKVSTTYTPLQGALPPGEVAIVFLSQADDWGPGKGTKCPAEVTPAFHKDPMNHGTAVTRAFRITTDAPVSAYSIFPYGGASSYYPTATLLLPTSAWGTNYVAVSTAQIVVAGGGSAARGFRTLQVVANEDDTEVRMRPIADVAGGRDVAGTPKNTVQSWKLSRGQVLQINQSKELTGSPIESNKPVALFGGAECAYLPSTYAACDLTQQQIAPLAQWGSEYALVPFRPRSEIPNAREKVPWSLVGAADGTVLSYDPARPVGAPETLAAGQTAVFLTDKIVSVRSQDKDHPFHAAAYMTGETFNGSSGGGDPEFVNIVPSDQFLDKYVFFTDFTFADTSIALVRRKTRDGFAPVKLDCAGEVTGWQPIGDGTTYEYAWLRLTRGHFPQTFAGGECGYGRHVAESDGPFSLTVWGTDAAASYGYPAGTGLRPITDVHVTVN